MLTIKAMTGAENYASRHLSNNDYYSKGETITGRWMGRGAQLLGLQGAVELRHFEALREGLHPETGEFLRQRKSADRFEERDGELVQRSAARNLYDFTISAPKAASVMAMKDPRIKEAHQRAANEAIAETESLADSYIRKNGGSGSRNTSNLVIAAYTHDASRELDPQLHTHFVGMNLTYDGVEGKWKALAAYQIYQHREYITEVYRNRFAKELNALGYELKDVLEHGQDAGFTIAGIERETLEKYSQRSKQRDEGIQKFIEENGRRPNNNEIARIIRDTREKNLAEISTPEVKAAQLARLTPEEARTLENVYQGALVRGSVQSAAEARPSLSYATEHVFERVSVARNHDLLSEALRHGRGRLDLRELKTELAARVAAGEMLQARGELATEATLERERRMVAAINAGRGQYKALGRPDFEVSPNAREEQRNAVKAILANEDFAYNLQGAAGVGKTVTLKEIRRGLAENRTSVLCVAPSASAVEVLRNDGFKDAVTIARLLVDPAMQEDLRGQVLIVDEAGMVSSQDMAGLIDLAQKKDARILFSGDTKQIKSVLEGDALRVLENESALQSVSLVQVQRQLNQQYREAMEALRSNPTLAYERLEAMGAIREVDWRFRAQEVSQAYTEESRKLNRFNQPSSVLVVAKTHDEISSISYAIRCDRKATGELAAGETFVRHSALNWTEAQRRQMRKYEPGQVLLFHKAVKKTAAKNEALEVVSSHKDHVTARRADGELVEVKPGNVKAFGVFEKEEMEIAAGDKLLFQTNWKGKRGEFKATNGERVTVAKVEGEKITLEDGREVPAAYRQFSYGYAVTANYSQGKSVDRVITLDDGMAQDKRYVAETRGREGLVIITSDALALQESMTLSGDRQSASELAVRAERAGHAWQQTNSIDPETLYAVYEEQQWAKEATTQTHSQEKERELYVERDYRGGDGAERALSL